MPSAPVIVAYAESGVPSALREQMLALHEQAWPRATAGHDPALHPVSLLLVEDGRVLSALDILSKEIEHAGERYTARGLSTVVTDEALRGRGHGRTLVSAARERIAASGADLGLFTCDRPLGPFYESAGWSIVPGAVVLGGTPDDPLPSDRWDKVTLAGFFSAKAQRGAETFTDSRIALYPGTIDRLW